MAEEIQDQVKASEPSPDQQAETQAPAPGDSSWRKTVERADKVLEKSAGTIDNLQSILTLMGAVLGAMAFLNLELGLLAFLNTFFHNLAAFIYRAKIPLLLGLSVAVVANLVWLARDRDARRARRHFAPLVVALILAAGVFVLKPLPYEVAVLLYEPAGGQAQTDNLLGTELARLLASHLEQGNETIKAVLASKGESASQGLAAVADEKGVDFVVSGEYALLGPNLQVKTRLYDARAQKYLLEEPIEHFDVRDNGDDIQSQTAASIISALPLYGTVRAVAAASNDALCASAYECYLRGRQYYRWYSADGYRQAIEAYERAIQLEPDYGLAHAGLAEARAFLAADLTWLSDYAAAEALLREASQSAHRAVELDPQSRESMRAAAFVYLVREFYEEADALVRRVEAVAPDDAETVWMRALLEPAAEQRLALLEHAVELAPNLTVARQSLARQLWNMGRPAEALPHLMAAIEQNPYDLSSYEGLGWIYLALDRPAEAEAQARIALDLEPRYGAARYLLSYALAAQGATVEADRVMQEAVEASPELGMFDARLPYEAPHDYDAVIGFLEGLRNQQPEFVHVYNELGNLYRNAGRIDDAEAAYREALRRDPSLGIAHLNLADLLAWERRQFDDAEREAAMAVERLPNLPGAFALHGHILGQLERFEEAETALQTVVELAPGSSWPYPQLAGLYLDMGRNEEALAQIEHMTRLEAGEAFPYNLWANLLFERGDYAGAAQYYQEAIDRLPDSSIYLSNLAAAQQMLGKDSDAQTSCRRAIELAPESNARAYLICARLRKDDNDYDGAEDVLQQGVTAIPSDSDLHREFGGLLNELGRYQEADQAFAKAVELQTRGISALNDWGIALDLRGDPEAATEKYLAALEVVPDDVGVMANLASSYAQLGELDAARGLIEQALVLNPADPWVHNVWGDVSLQQGAYSEALEHYLQSVNLEPGNPYYLRDVAEAHFRLGEPAEADRAFAAAFDANPEDATTLNNWGVLLYEQGRIDEAEAKYQSALELTPNDPVLLTNLGDVYWNRDEVETAAKLYQQAAEIEPGYDYALASWGLALWYLDRPQPAAEKLRAAIAIDPSILWYHTTLADIQIETGNLEEARETLAQASALAPGSPVVEELIEYLRQQAE